MVACVLSLVIGGFIMMFIWANQIDYQTLYSNISQDDASAIVAILKEQNVPFQLTGDGTIIKVPAEKVYELRLALASEGIPKGDHVGFEVFDNTTFSTTEFVQKLNYQRALQGELARTISQFEEVDHARVLLVMPEESLFVEDEKMPSASVLLKLRSSLSSRKVEGIVNLVSSAVEGLDSSQVTVVDTSGKILYKGPGEPGEEAAKMQSEYQRKYEQRMMDHIQSMLERIVGDGKAIVRVNADINFDQIEIKEERFDPDGSAIRSEQHKEETSQRSKPKPEGATEVESGTTEWASGSASTSQKKDRIINYEITKVARHVSNPFGTLKRLSVAAVVDGVYQNVKAEDGAVEEQFKERSQEELMDLEEIIKRAMGYNADREDQVSIRCMQFSVKPEIFIAEKDWMVYARPYIKPILNLILILIVFLFVIRPVIKSFKDMAKAKEAEEKPAELPEPSTKEEELPDIAKMSLRDRVVMIANNYPDKTESWVRGWINEVESVPGQIGKK